MSRLRTLLASVAALALATAFVAVAPAARAADDPAELVRLVADRQASSEDRIAAAKRLAEGIVDQLRETMRLRATLTPYSCETGRIGTDIAVGTIKAGERFLALNDVTTRGNCVSKLGKVITDNGGQLAGMMVFARRDSGQFPLMNELIAQHPFYYATDLDMPQWEAALEEYLEAKGVAVAASGGGR